MMASLDPVTLTILSEDFRTGLSGMNRLTPVYCIFLAFDWPFAPSEFHSGADMIKQNFIVGLGRFFWSICSNTLNIKKKQIHNLAMKNIEIFVCYWRRAIYVTLVNSIRFPVL
jgi:hypothetical protein